MKKAIYVIREIWRVLFRRFIDFTSKLSSIERNRPPDNPILSISGMDCEFRKIEFNPIKLVQIFRMDVEYFGFISATPKKEKIQHFSSQ
jgi:hypothetical protein